MLTDQSDWNSAGQSLVSNPGLQVGFDLILKIFQQERGAAKMLQTGTEELWSVKRDW
jgi:hypothetical protein